MNASAAKSDAEVYTRIGVRPFINCTATYTINGGALMLPEVISTMERAAHYQVNLDELMEKVGERLAALLQVEWGIVTGGCAASLVHATAGCIAGTDPEKMQRLPNLEGLKNEVIIPRESRHMYDHAIRSLGTTIVEVNSVQDVRAAIGPRTAMIVTFGNYFGDRNSFARDLEEIVRTARPAGVPILVDAAADYPIVPNPYLACGADLVAYSGGKIIRGPQTAGLLVGRRDLVRAAWANASPHHAFGRPAKVGKEAIVGMLRAVELWRTERDIEAEFREWKSWYAYIREQITQVAGVDAEVRGPVRGGPFPTLEVSWDPSRISLTADELGEALLAGEPRIMTHAHGEGHSFPIRPASLRPGEYRIVADRLRQVFESAPQPEKRTPAPPVCDISGTWEVDISYEVGSARHQLVVTTRGNGITGSHIGWAYRGAVEGWVDGSRVRMRSSIPAEGTHLFFTFTGIIRGETMSGELRLGEYGQGRWCAKRA